MKKYLILLLLITGCISNNKRVDKIFEKGVQISLNALNEYEANNFEEGDKLNLIAISKFKEIIDIDSNHSDALSQIGHAYFLLKEYKKSIIWHDKAIEIDTNNSLSQLEYGISLMNFGEITDARKSIKYALEIDKSDEIKLCALSELKDINQLSEKYSKKFEGDSLLKNKYDNVSLEVLKLIDEIN